MAALSPTETIIFQADCLERGFPTSDKKNSLDIFSDAPDFSRMDRYFLVHLIATTPRGTARSLLPFPKTVANPSSRFRLRGLRLINSETRIPVAYRTSSMALSRRPIIVEVSGVERRRSTSSGTRKRGNDCQDLGDSRLAQGSIFR